MTGRLAGLARPVLAAAVAVALAAAAVVVVVLHRADAEPRFSYLTSTDLVVATPAGVEGRTPAVPATGGAASTTTWTADGRYAVVVAEGPGGSADSEHRTLAVVDRRGVASVRPCPRCTTVVGIGGSEVLVSQALVDPATVAESAPPAGFLRFDLSDGRPGTAPPPHAGAEALNRLFLVAGVSGAGFALTQPTERGTGNREDVFVLHRDGTSEPFGAHRPTLPRGSNQRGIGKAAAREDTTGRLLAVSASSRNSRNLDCSNSMEVYVLRTGDQFGTDTDMRAALPPGRTAGVDTNVLAVDLWWGDDGRLRTILAVQPCLPSDRDPDPMLSQWVLDGTRWSADGGASVLAHRDLGEGASLDLRPVPDTGSDSGDLVVRRDGSESVIDRDVLDFSIDVAPSGTGSESDLHPGQG